MESIIANLGTIYLGISAGNHSGFKHPNFETLNEIKSIRKDINILSANICQNRIMDSPFDKEYHIWYDDCIARNYRYGKDEPNTFDLEINDVISKSSYSDKLFENNKESYGLFAYIFEISDNLDQPIKVRMALSKTNKLQNCFHESYCDKSLISCKKEYKQSN